MERLNLPLYDHRISLRDGKEYIFDPIRKKHYQLSPEEWVRQNFVQYLINEKGYPASLLSVEMGLKLNNMQRRSDIVAFSREGKPLLVVECKAADVKINQNTFDQIARYNISLQVGYLVATNGMKHYCCRMDPENNSYDFLKDIPSWEEIS